MITIMIICMMVVMYKIKMFEDAHMKVSREQVAEHRLQIVAAAAPLFVRHRDNRATSWLFSRLGTKAARGSAELRHSMTEAVRRRIGHLSAEAKGDAPRAKRRAAIAAWSAMVGAMVLARIIDDEKLSKKNPDRDTCVAGAARRLIRL
jgi:hypothetical protein